MDRVALWEYNALEWYEIFGTCIFRICRFVSAFTVHTGRRILCDLVTVISYLITGPEDLDHTFCTVK